MEVIHDTPFSARLMPILDKDGSEARVVVFKATYELDATGALRIAEEQAPVLAVDEHMGEPSSSSVRFEGDGAYFDEESMQVVIQLSMGLARVTEASGFLVQFFSGVERLRQFDEPALRELLLDPSLSLHGEQPLLLVGARSSLVSRAEIETAWGTGVGSNQVMESVSGYVLLNLLDTRGLDSGEDDDG